MDAKDGHLIDIAEVLQQLRADTTKSSTFQGGGGGKAESKREPAAAPTLTLGVMKKYCDVLSLQAVRTRMSKALLSLMGSMPWTGDQNTDDSYFDGESLIVTVGRNPCSYQIKIKM